MCGLQYTSPTEPRQTLLTHSRPRSSGRRESRNMEGGGKASCFALLNNGFPGYFTRPFLDHGFPHCCPPISRRVKAKVAPYPVYVGEARSRLSLKLHLVPSIPWDP
jgi:hypothetical protein